MKSNGRNQHSVTFDIQTAKIHPIGLRCIAACIFDEHREPFAAISISGPISRMTDDRVTELGALVIKAAKEVTLAYGGIR